MGIKYLHSEMDKCMAQKVALQIAGTGKGQTCALLDILISTDQFSLKQKDHGLGSPLCFDFIG